MKVNINVEKTTIVVKTQRDSEELLLSELKAGKIGTNHKILNRAVSFTGGLKDLFLATMSIRTGMSILYKIHEYKAKNADELYRGAKEVAWDKIFNTRQTFKTESVLNSINFQNSMFTSLRIKDAIVDSFREIYGTRPSIDREDPDVVIHSHLEKDTVSLYLNAAPIPLYKRGYRGGGHAAPLNEVLAASILMRAGFKNGQTLVDGMCGTGTFSSEAVLIAINYPPNVNRKDFCFFNWKQFNNTMYKEAQEELLAKVVPLESKFIAIDTNPDSLETCKAGLMKLPNRIRCKYINESFFDYTPEGLDNALVVLNPPYGQRLEEMDIDAFYENIGNTLKHKYQGCQAWIIASEESPIKKLGLKTDKTWRVKNGDIDCKLLSYTLFAGTHSEFKSK